MGSGSSVLVGSHSVLGGLSPLLRKTWGRHGCMKCLRRCPQFSHSFIFLLVVGGDLGSYHLMINWGGVQRDRQPRGYCDMALRCLQQGDKGWEFGGKMQQQDGNALCAIAPFAGGTHGAPQPQDVPVLRDAPSLWHTLGEPRNL